MTFLLILAMALFITISTCALIDKLNYMIEQQTEMVSEIKIMSKKIAK
jgi:hypothetical protein